VLLVSRSWYQVLDQYIGVHAVLGRGVSEGDSSDEDDEDVENMVLNSQNILKNLGISTCEFINFVNQSDSAPKLKRPDLLRRVTFKKFASSATFESILDERVTNLQLLKIDHSALRHLEFSDITMSLSHCEALEVIKSGGYRRHWEETWNYWNIFSNTAFLFTKKFPGLKCLKFNFPTDRYIEEDLARAILNLLFNHSDSLTSVQIALEEEYNGYMKSKGNFKLPDKSQYTNFTTYQLNHKLQKLDLELFLGYPLSPESRSLWETWFMTFRALKTLRMMESYAQKYFQSVIVHNAGSLESLDMGWSYCPRISEPDEQGNLISNVVDCLIFENCLNLTRLNLRTRRRYSEDHLGLFNAASIPKTLVQISIVNIILDNESCRLFCLDFPNLKTLKLKNVAAQDGFGVQLPVVTEMMERKQLQKFQVQLGFGANRILPPNVLNLTNNIFYSHYLRGYLHRNGDYGKVPEEGPDSEDENN